MKKFIGINFTNVLTNVKNLLVTKKLFVDKFFMFLTDNYVNKKIKYVGNNSVKTVTDKIVPTHFLNIPTDYP